MRRRTVFAICATALVAGCTRPVDISRSKRQSEVASVGNQPVVSWQWVGGLTSIEYVALSRPTLVVYADGLAVADARWQSRLWTAEVASLVTTAADAQRQSSGLGPPQCPPVDGMAAEIVVRNGTGEYSLTVDPLDDPCGHPVTYPPALHEVWNRLTAAYEAIVARRLTYTAARVRLAAVPALPVETSAVRPWPVGIPSLGAPAPSGSGWARLWAGGPYVIDRDGEQAAAAVAALPVDPERPQDWAILRDALDDRAWRVAVRYLLRHE